MNKLTGILLPILLLLMCACNKDETITAGARPEIILDNETGVYDVKVGNTLTIAPTFRNVRESDIVWTIDSEVVAKGPVWTARWDEAGVWYVRIEARGEYATAVEEIRVDVLEPEAPEIVLAVPADGYVVETGHDYLFEPVFRGPGPITVEWIMNGKTVSGQESYVFNADVPGDYNMEIRATNEDGTSTLSFVIHALESLPQKVVFPPLSFFNPEAVRYVFPGMPCGLNVVTENFEDPVFYWSVNGTDVDTHTADMQFTPSEAGEYLVSVKVRESGEEIAGIWLAEASLKVVCVDATEMQRMRKATASSSDSQTVVYEWCPAPGQFIGEPGHGDVSTLDDACRQALDRMEGGRYVSLGSFGGYVIVGFDHSIEAAKTGSDFAIAGNSFFNPSGASNEPGTVWVMQDVNGNGKPDDIWYELRGSEWDNASVRRNFAVTYTRPAPASDVPWTANDGTSGTVGYLGAVHGQQSYYPAWVSPDSYTLFGTCLPANNYYDSDNLMWVTSPYAWGYADNVGDDILPWEGQWTGFSISNAVLPDGAAARLSYIDFIMVRTAVLAKSGGIGEVSTEVLGFKDCSITKNNI